MGRPKSIGRGMFNVPKLSKTIATSTRTKRTIFPGKIPQPEPKVVVDVTEVPTIKMGAKRTGLLKHLLERGRVKKSELSFGDLQVKTHNSNLLHTEVDCMDEAELRARFPKQGVNHKFFSGGDYKYEFWLPSNSDQVVVAQVIWNGKVRLPNFIQTD
jgi:hypothetical protein